MTPADIEAALKYQKLMNAWPNRWARFRSEQFDMFRITVVEVGYILSDGNAERKIETVTFDLKEDGTVETHRHAHV